MGIMGLILSKIELGEVVEPFKGIGLVGKK